MAANAEFQGKNTIKVHYVLTYRDGKIVNEIWRIDPNLGLDCARVIEADRPRHRCSRIFLKE